MGYIFLGITLLLIGAGTIIIVLVSKARGNCAFALISSGMVIMAISLILFLLGIDLYSSLDGIYELVPDSSGNYLTINNNGNYEVTIIDNGIPHTHICYDSTPEIHIGIYEQARVEINKGNWSSKYKVYIPESEEAKDGDVAKED